MGISPCFFSVRLALKKKLASSKKKMQHARIIAFDLEGAGQYLESNPVVQIAAVCKDKDGNILSRFSEEGRCEPEQYEASCRDEFWAKVDSAGTKRKRYEGAQDAYAMWKNFYEYLRGEFTPEKDTLVICDNPGYDACVATYNFQRYFHGRSLHYVSGSYHAIRDVHSLTVGLAAARGVNRKDWEANVLEWYLASRAHVTRTEHTHDARDDANKIANIWLAAAAYAEHCKTHSGKAPF